jgi:hypothetical protein
MTNHPNRNQYVITKPVPSRLMGAIENLLPSYARSVECLHGETDADPIRYRAHQSEIKHVRRAIRIAQEA